MPSLFGPREDTASNPRESVTDDKQVMSGPLSRSSSALNLSALVSGFSIHQKRAFAAICQHEPSFWDVAAAHLNAHNLPVIPLTANDKAARVAAGATFAVAFNSFATNAGLPVELVGPEGAEEREKCRQQFLREINSFTAQYLDIAMPSTSPEERLRRDSFVADSPPETTYPYGLQQLRNVNNQNLNAAGTSAFFTTDENPFIRRSIFTTENAILGFVGQGGYGAVFKVRNHLDNCEYAIKRIVIKSEKITKVKSQVEMDALVSEVRTLGRLNHPNIVRYHHAWVEKHATDDDDLLGIGTEKRLAWAPSRTTTVGESYATESSYEREEASFEATSEQILFEGAGDDAFVFEEDSTSRDNMFATSRDRRNTIGTTSSSATYHRASMLSSDEPADEEVDRGDMTHAAPLSPSHAETSPRKSEEGSIAIDMILYIKMSLHPTTLEHFLSMDSKHRCEELEARHCFHQDVAVNILLAILDGVEYLHHKGVVHRDLKPANIFLSVDKPSAPYLRGCINIRDCSGCVKDKKGKENEKEDEDSPIWLTPHIGDFGLSAIMDDSVAKNPTSSSTKDSASGTFQPSLIAKLEAEKKAVGTTFYRPLAAPKKEPFICQKLDVYALGIIAFELIAKFTTKTERHFDLGKLRTGVPLWAGLEEHKMMGGIKKMVCEDRDERWDAAKVREWLEGLKQAN